MTAETAVGLLRRIEEGSHRAGVAEDVVFMLADLLGPNEDRDGLLTSLEDAAEYDMFKE